MNLFIHILILSFVVIFELSIYCTVVYPLCTSSKTTESTICGMCAHFNKFSILMCKKLDREHNLILIYLHILNGDYFMYFKILFKDLVFHLIYAQFLVVFLHQPTFHLNLTHFLSFCYAIRRKKATKKKI